MKVKFTVFFLFLTARVFGQVSENFDKASLSTGSLACWSSTNNATNACERIAAQVQSTPLSADPHLSLNTSTPIGGSASIAIKDSVLSPGSGCQGTSVETLNSVALGADGNTVSFDLRINNLVLPAPYSVFNVTIICGDFNQQFTYTTADIGSTIPISTVISGSNGGGIISIQLYLITASTTTYESYSVDIDNFATTAPLDPNNACVKALPVTLVSFTAQQAGQLVKLAWATNVEQNSKGFEIQRSADARQWQPVGLVNSEKPNSNTYISYSWYDEVPLAGINYYRLRQTDLDGSSQYSKIQALAFNAEGPISIAPNPTTERALLRNVNPETLATIRMVDTNGKILYTSNNLPADGIDVKHLLPGVYYVHIVTTYGQTQIQKLVKQ